MKLSEAIRFGATMKPQIFNRWHDAEGSCAMRAAYEAVGVWEKLRTAGTVEENKALIASLGWSELCDKHYNCPECGIDYSHIPITHLNDGHHWTRERIADWVETVENAQQEHKVGELAEVLP